MCRKCQAKCVRALWAPDSQGQLVLFHSWSRGDDKRLTESVFELTCELLHGALVELQRAGDSLASEATCGLAMDAFCACATMSSSNLSTKLKRPARTTQ